MGVKLLLGTCAACGIGLSKLCEWWKLRSLIYDSETKLLKGDRAHRGEYWGCVVEFKSEGGASIPKEYLRERVLAILTENPWLTGTVVGRRLVWPSSLQHGTYDHDYLTILDEQNLHDFPFTDVRSTLRKYLVQSKQGSHDLFNLYAWETEGGGYCLMVSLSRVVADAATFYTILNMLGMGEDVVPLTPERIQKDEARERLGVAGWVPAWLKWWGVGREFAVALGDDTDVEKCSIATRVISWWLSRHGHDRWKRTVDVDLRALSPFYSRQMAGNYTGHLVFYRRQPTTPSALHTLSANFPPSAPSCLTAFVQTADLTSYYRPMLLPHSTHLMQHLMVTPSLSRGCYVFQATEHDVHVVLTNAPAELLPADKEVICKLL